MPQFFQFRQEEMSSYHSFCELINSYFILRFILIHTTS
jgi:hypothetical protein